MTRMLLPQNLRPLRSLRTSFAPSSPPIFVPKQRDQCINCQSQLRLAAFGVWGRDFVAVFNAIYHNSSTILTSCKKLRCFHYVRNIITFQPQPCVSVYCITVIWYILTTTFHYSINQLIFFAPRPSANRTWGQELRCQDVRLLPNAWHSAPRTRAVGRKLQLPPLGPCRFWELIYYEWLTNDIVIMYWWFCMMYIIWIVLGLYILIISLIISSFNMIWQTWYHWCILIDLLHPLRNAKMTRVVISATTVPSHHLTLTCVS